jgi:hypothetical protein
MINEDLLHRLTSIDLGNELEIKLPEALLHYIVIIIINSIG